MILERTGELIPTDDFVQYHFGGTVHYVHGFFYIPGFHAGEESCAEVEKTLKETGCIPFERMYGAFNYCIRKEDGEIFFFPCNSYLHCLYVSNRAFTSGYLEHLRCLRDHGDFLTFDTEAVCEYCTLNNLYFGKTYVKEISVFPNEQYIHVKGGVLECLEKGIGDIAAPSQIQDPTEFYDQLAYALSDQPAYRTALSLTGGYDSRMIYAQLHQKLPLRVFLSTNNFVSLADVPIAQKICRLTEAELTIYDPPKPAVSEFLIRTLFVERDGLNPMSINTSWIQHFWKTGLKKNCAAIQITGDSGPLHKDWEWTIDFPFYHRKTINLKKFYRQRLSHLSKPEFLGQRLFPFYQMQEQRFVHQMKPYCRRINSESYDSLYYYVSADRRCSYNWSGIDGFTQYAPLAELELVRYSYHLPRRKRFFHQYMREVTTNGNAEIARLPTTHTTNASSEFLYKLKDVFCQVYDWGKRAVHMVYRHFTHKLLYQPRHIWSTDQELRTLPLAGRAVSWATAEELLKSEATIEMLSQQSLEQIIHLYLLHEEYGISFESIAALRGES